MATSIAKPATHLGNVYDAFTEITGELIWLWWDAIAVAV